MDSVKAELRQYLEDRLNVAPQRFSHEPQYVAAMLGRIDGTAWSSDDGEAYIEIRSTVAESQIRESAERKYGADFAITIRHVSDSVDVEKAVLGQAKRGRVEELSKARFTELVDQCERMSRVTPEFLVLETPHSSSGGIQVRLGIKGAKVPWAEEKISFSDYLIERLIKCDHGDRRSEFIEAVQDGAFSKMEVIVRGLDHGLNLDYTPQPPRPPFRPKPR